MSNKFVTFLDNVGKAFTEGLKKITPFVEKAVELAQVASPYVQEIDPAIGPIFATTVATVASIEQKFAAMSQQTGTGAQKLEEAYTILRPVITQAFSAANKPNGPDVIKNYITAVVNFLNAIPAALVQQSTPAAPATTPAPAAG